MGEAADILIGVMKTADMEQVLAIEQVSFASPWTRRLFENELLRPEVSTLLVAYTEAEASGTARYLRLILGYIVFWVVADEMHILNLSVHPLYRRRGIARRLVIEAVRRASAMGAEKAYLEVRASNAPATALYSSLGFVSIGIRRSYYDNPREDAVVMTLEGRAFRALGVKAEKG